MPILSMALPEDSQQPIEISADSAIKDEQQGLTIYQGAVTMRQGSLLIEADTVTIRAETGAIKSIIAEGQPARFQQQPAIGQQNVVAKGNTIQYNVSQKIVTLTENASLDQAGSSISGNSITYDIDAGRIEAGTNSSGEPGRVNVVIPPPQTQP